MFKLEFILNQHTPIIHFQHDQEGATLRATEVKPKLDQFIINTKGGWENITDKWKIGNGKAEHEALDYKIKIHLTNNSNIEWFSREDESWKFPCFFANMGDENKNKYRLNHINGSLSLIIISFNQDLLKCILENICIFFSQNTFGTRQSKGFGTFYPDKNSIAFRENTFYKDPQKKYSFTIDISQLNTKWKKEECVFKHIDLFYRLLRSGLNRKAGPNFEHIDINRDGDDEFITNRHTNFYCKPVIFLYLKDKGIQWDKKTIKQYLFNKDFYSRNPDYKERIWISQNNSRTNIDKVYDRGFPQQRIKYKNPDTLRDIGNPPFYLWRDLFGLSSLEEWKSYKKKLSKTHAKFINNNWVKRLEDDIETITRFKSPLQFLPIISTDNKKYTVYFSSEDIPSLYSGSHFIISNNNSEFELQIGNLNNLDLIIDWLLLPNKFDLSSQWTGDRNVDEYKFLAQVMNSLKRI